MPNKSGNAYGLTTLCPIVDGIYNDQSHAAALRDHLDMLPVNELSPMAAVPNTYLCRFYVLNDVFFEGSPAKEEHLKSKYLVFTSNFHGELDDYLEGMWNHAEQAIKEIWQHCIAFDQVNSAQDFVDYIKKCQVETTFLFNGSTDDSLAEQLKALYLKQEFSKFAFENQGKTAEELQQAFLHFAERTQPDNSQEPSWRPGIAECP